MSAPFDPRDHVLGLVSGLSPTDRARCWLMMLQAYIDDSGSEPTDPYFVLGGFIAKVDSWLEFNNEWKATLVKEPAIRYFRMTEARNRRGEFEHGWSVPLIHQRVDELAQVATRYAEYRAHCIMPWNEFNAYLKDIGDDLIEPYNTSFKNPYFLCFFSIALAINARIRQLGISECEYIFDRQGKVGEFTADVYKILQKDLKLNGGSTFKDDRRELPLQAADLYAWNAHDILLRPSGGEIDLHLKKTLFRLPDIEVVLDRRHLVSFRETLLEAARRAPQYLRRGPSRRGANFPPSMMVRTGEAQEATIERLEKSAADLRRLVEAWRQKS